MHVAVRKCTGLQKDFYAKIDVRFANYLAKIDARFANYLLKIDATFHISLDLNEVVATYFLQQCVQSILNSFF